MAGLRDSNGKIVIDEAEAESEAKKIELAKSKLDEAMKLLDPSKIDSNRMRGETGDALQEIFKNFSKDFQQQSENCKTTAEFIRKVVTKYKRIDQEYSAKIKGGK